jgi:hypothetical protein
MAFKSGQNAGSALKTASRARVTVLVPEVNGPTRRGGQRAEQKCKYDEWSNGMGSETEQRAYVGGQLLGRV